MLGARSSTLFDNTMTLIIICCARIDVGSISSQAWTALSAMSYCRANPATSTVRSSTLGSRVRNARSAYARAASQGIAALQGNFRKQHLIYHLARLRGRRKVTRTRLIVSGRLVLSVSSFCYLPEAAPAASAGRPKTMASAIALRVRLNGFMGFLASLDRCQSESRCVGVVCGIMVLRMLWTFRVAAMPELPEVEVSRLGLLPFLSGQRITGAVIRTQKLRHEILPTLPQRLAGLRVNAISRRGKYLLFDCESAHGGGWLIIHLGMSGSLRLVAPGTPVQKHDHVDLIFEHTLLRFRDPRRFGALIWHEGPDVGSSPSLAVLGIEPLSPEFDGDWLYQATRQRSGPIKPLLMDSHLVVGIGNIYAAESLFRAGISPLRAAKPHQPERYRVPGSGHPRDAGSIDCRRRHQRARLRT